MPPMVRVMSNPPPIKFVEDKAPIPAGISEVGLGSGVDVGLGVAVSGIGVAVGTDVAVGGIGIAVGGTGVAVGGTGVAVGTNV